MQLQMAGIVSDSGGVGYDPGMMTFTSGYYNKTVTFSSATLQTFMFRGKIASFTGGGFMCIADTVTGSNVARFTAFIFSSDYAITELRNKLRITVQNSASANIMNLLSIGDFCDNTKKTIFFSSDSSGSPVATFYMNGADADDSGYSGRQVASGSMSVVSTVLNFGRYNATTPYYYQGEGGYFGYRDGVALTNPNDFHHPTNGLQELDESGWTEWGAQPEFWNQYCTMTDNKGSGGNMNANGTITGPA